MENPDNNSNSNNNNNDSNKIFLIKNISKIFYKKYFENFLQKPENMLAKNDKF